jgi:hypothetical protein
MGSGLGGADLGVSAWGISSALTSGSVFLLPPWFGFGDGAAGFDSMTGWDGCEGAGGGGGKAALMNLMGFGSAFFFDLDFAGGFGAGC